MKLKIKLLKGGDFELDVDAGSKVRLLAAPGHLAIGRPLLALESP